MNVIINLFFMVVLVGMAVWLRVVLGSLNKELFKLFKLLEESQNEDKTGHQKTYD